MNKLNNLINLFYNYISISENIIDDDTINNKISKYDYIDKKKIKSEIIILFGSDIQNRINIDNDYSTIIKFLKKEKIYIIKLMDFDKEISISNIILKSKINYLLEQYTICKEIETLENNKWIVINYSNDTYELYYLYIFSPIKKYLQKLFIFLHIAETR